MAGTEDYTTAHVIDLLQDFRRRHQGDEETAEQVARAVRYLRDRGSEHAVLDRLSQLSARLELMQPVAGDAMEALTRSKLAEAERAAAEAEALKAGTLRHAAITKSLTAGVTPRNVLAVIVIMGLALGIILLGKDVALEAFKIWATKDSTGLMVPERAEGGDGGTWNDDDEDALGGT